MESVKAIFLIITVYFSINKTAAATDKIICYYESWATSYPPNDIDLNICTHINYAFLGIKSDGSLKIDSEGVIKQIAGLKSKNSKVKLLVSVGGWSEGSSSFSQVARSSEKRSTFAKNINNFLKKYKYDGVDIDWEYPAQRKGSSPNDKKNYISLLQELRKQLGASKLITVAVSSTPDDKSYDVKEISKVVDFINVMTYDFHEGGESKTGENAPLYASSVDKGWAKENLNCDSAIKNWIKKGANTQKVIMGLAFYGHSFKLKDKNQHGIGAPSSGSGIKSGTVNYNQICKLAKSDGWTRVFDNTQKVPYIYKDLDWIGYDDPQSIALKVQYAKKMKLGGVMMWAVDNDDNKGVCGTKNPLLQAIKKNI